MNSAALSGNSLFTHIEILSSIFCLLAYLLAILFALCPNLQPRHVGIAKPRPRDTCHPPAFQYSTDELILRASTSKSSAVSAGSRISCDKDRVLHAPPYTRGDTPSYRNLSRPVLAATDGPCTVHYRPRSLARLIVLTDMQTASPNLP